MGVAGAAWASEFVVVSSTDPAIHAGQALDAGAHLGLAPGRSVTVIRPSGEVTTLQGSPHGATVPGVTVAQASPARLETLQALFQRPPSGRTFGARRGFCPAAESLTTMDAILTAYQNGCHSEARHALHDYLEHQGVAPGTLDGPAPAPTATQ